jgi:hypothetical protein
MNSYLFILCPPFSGSTVLWKLVSTSKAVSSLPGEGQFLPEVKEIMRKDPWNPRRDLPWEMIKKVWRDYWDLDKPWLVEKSPPNLIRAKDIVKHFEPLHFLVMVRNPYAHCASLIRRNGWDATRAAEFSARCLRFQADNAETLDNSLRFTYEHFVTDPQAIARDIQAALPHIGELKWDATFRVHSSLSPAGELVSEQKIINHNEKSIVGLSHLAMQQISAVLRQHSDSIRYWGYEDYEPPLTG